MRLRRILGLSVCLLPGVASAQVFDPNQIVSPANLSPPGPGQTVQDTAFGVTIRRLTDRGSSGGLATAEYPQLQAINADETRILISTDNGYDVMEIGSWQITHNALSMSIPRWSPVDPDALWHVNGRNANPIIMQRTDLSPGGGASTTDVVNLTSLGFSSLEYGSWEDLSEDGRYVGLHGTRNGTLVAAVLDLQTGQIRGQVDISNVDWVSVSPSGSYFVVQYVSRGTGPTDGLVVYDASDGAFLGHLSDHHEHGDIGRDHLGQEVFVTIAYTDYCANGAVPCYSVAPFPDSHEAGLRRDLGTPDLGNYTSCRNLRRGGFCLHSDDSSTPGSAPFAGEVWLVRLSDGEVMRLAHHRSSSCSYYNLTRPTLSPTGRYALFTSDWGNPNCNDSADLYLVDLEPMVTGWIGGTPPQDAGVADSGPPPDAGPQEDAGSTGGDGGLTPQDAGGDRTDGGVDPGPDANVPGDSDAGRPPPTGARNRSTRGGCGCSAATPLDRGGWPLLGLSLVLLLLRRR